MDHPHHSDESSQGQHGHPETFDEVIARGFPHRELKALAKAHQARIRQHHAALEASGEAPRIALLPQATAAVAAATRENQARLSSAKKTAFRNAVSRLVQEGKYRELVQHHREMSHNMHGTMGEVGLYRFLAWHRRYLLEFERELQRVDAILRPTAKKKLAIPYWRWQDPFPAWLVGFLPATDPVSGAAPPPRKNAPPPPSPTPPTSTSSSTSSRSRTPGSPARTTT